MKDMIPTPTKPPSFSALSAGLALHREVAADRRRLKKKATKKPEPEDEPDEFDDEVEE